MSYDPLALLIQRIRAVCAKNYPLKVFLVAETSKLAIACGQRAIEATNARA